MATFTFFEDGDTVDSIDRVFTSAWSNGVNDLGSIDGFYSSSTQYGTGPSSVSASAAFYMDIYDKPPTDRDWETLEGPVPY